MLTSLVLALAAAATTVAAAATVAGPSQVKTVTGIPERCALWSGGVRPAAGTGQPRAKRLGELPPADHVLTVYRTVEGCPVPVIVRSEIGGR